MRVLFTTNPLPGHFFPLVPLAWAFRSLGHEVLVATSGSFVPSVLSAGLSAVPCGPPADFVDLVPDEAVNGTLEERREVHGQAFSDIAARNLAGIESLVDSWRPDLMVVERAEFAGPVAAAARGVPCVEVHWGVPALTEYRSAADGALTRELAQRGLDAVPEPDWVLNPWPPGLRLGHAEGHDSIRHVPYDTPAAVPCWVAGPRTRIRICLTFGTVLPRMAADDLPALVLPLLRRLARLDVELVVAVDDRTAAAWSPLPDAVLHAGPVPLSQVLTACDYLVHHGGNGTSLTALAAGIPQLVLPQFDDQLENGAAVAKAGAGLRLLPEELGPEAVAAATEELVETPRYAAGAAAVAADIAAQPSPVDVARRLADAVG